MPHTETRAENRAWNQRQLGVALNSIVAIVGAFTKWQRSAATHRAIADLTPDQLKDIDHREVPRPTLTVKAGLIANLMSMR